MGEAEPRATRLLNITLLYFSILVFRTIERASYHFHCFYTPVSVLISGIYFLSIVCKSVHKAWQSLQTFIDTIGLLGLCHGDGCDGRWKHVGESSRELTSPLRSTGCFSPHIDGTAACAVLPPLMCSCESGIPEQMQVAKTGWQ